MWHEIDQHTQNDMSPAEIKYKLALVNKTQTDVANAACVTPQSVNKVINGILFSQKIAEKLCEATGVPIKEMFPNGLYEDAA